MAKNDDLGIPAIDTIEEPGRYIVKIPIPGMSKADIALKIIDGVVEVSAQKAESSKRTPAYVDDEEDGEFVTNDEDFDESKMSPAFDNDEQDDGIDKDNENEFDDERFDEDFEDEDAEEIGKEEEEEMFYSQSYSGFFCRFPLPPNIDEKKITAHFANALLEIIFPKTKEKKMKNDISEVKIE